jgi:uncharacterized repeat protein (TIGR01451 family)
MNRTYMLLIKKMGLLMLALAIVLFLSGTVLAKSLYVIADINAYPDIPIEAYDIQAAPTYLAYQTTSYIPDRAGGAVGITIDTDTAYLFVTFEYSNELDLVDGTTMTTVGSVTAPGATNLAGIVVDQEKSKVYTVDRNTNHLYVYDWDSAAKTLTLEGDSYIELECNSGLYDIALDENADLLYVGDSSTEVKYFSTDDWSKQGEFTVSHAARGIAIDVDNQIVYTGSGGPYSSSYILSKYDLGTATETTKDTGGIVLGIAVDPASDLVYFTTYGYGTAFDRLIVYDKDLNELWKSDDLGNPTGIAIPGKDISYNPLNLNKADSGDCVMPDETFTYTISFTNPNDEAMTGVVIEDTLPSELDFVSASDAGTYSGGKVTWDLGSVSPGTDSVTVDVKVKPGTAYETVFTNSVTIDSEQTGPTTQSEDTEVCEEPAPTPTPSPSPSPTETPSPSPSPTETPSPSPSPTETPSPTPTVSPSPTPTTSPTPGPTPIPEFTTIGGGIVLIGSIYHAMKKRKKQN